MAVEEDNNREGRRAHVAPLDEARGRRARRRSRTPPVAAAETFDSDAASAEGSYGYTLDLAGMLDEPQAHERTASASADEILAQHQAPAAAAEDRSSADARAFADDDQSEPAAGRSNDMPAADEILAAISAHHEREQTNTGQAGPRGSADLEPLAPRHRRASPSSSPHARDGAGRGRRVPRVVAISAAILAIAIAIPVVAITGGSPRARYGARDHVTVDANLYKTLTIAKRTLAKPAARKQTPSETSTRRHKLRRDRAATRHHAATPAAMSVAIESRSGPTTPARTPVVASPTSAPSTSPMYSSGPTYSGSSGSGSTRPPPTYSGSSGSGSTRPPSTRAPSSSSHGTASPPAGPSATAGGTVGGNCNPKCS